jgi:hypothetical protein
VTTSLLLTLFHEHQPYIEALRVPGDIILEIVEAKLDEGLSYLEGDNARLARSEVQITKEFGSVKEFVSQAMKEKTRFGDII